MVVNVEIYNDHIRQVKNLSLSVASLEETLKGYKYDGESKPRDEEVERLEMPPMTLAFYSFLFDTGTIPSDMSFAEIYLNNGEFSYIPNGKVEVNYKGKRKTVSLDGLYGRILRTYPSLIRDLHFYLLAKESGLFESVSYSVKSDFEDKVDVKVRYKGVWHNVGLMLGSKRSLGFKIKKVFRHKPVDTIDIELKTEDARPVGDYLLYSPSHIHALLETIQSRQTKKHHRI